MKAIDWFLEQPEAGNVASQVDVILLEIALCFSAADGSMSRQEVNVVKTFLDGRLSEGDQASRDQRRETINNVFPKLLDEVRLAFSARTIPALLEHVCRRLLAISHQPQTDALEAIDLALQVALADEYLNVYEDKLLTTARQALNVTSEHVEHLSQVRNLHHEAKIPGDWTFEQAIDFLNAEYRHWRAKTSHDEFAVRGEAIGRIRSIVMARAKLESSRDRMQRRVFISHATADRGFVEDTLIGMLKEQGMECWYSNEDIKGGDAWERSIRQGLADSGWFLVVLSPHAIGSKWVRTEVHWGLEKRPDNFVPIIIEKCNADELNLELLTRQFIDFSRDPVKARDQLAKAWTRAK